MKAVAAISCGALAAPAFLSPLSRPTLAPRSAPATTGAQTSAPESAASVAATPLVGMGLVGVAVAAASARGRGRSEVVSTAAFDPTKELGVQAPVQFWDPLGFCNDGDEAAYRRRRSVELKHGRISMIACIGYIVPEYFRFPGYLSPSQGIKFSDVPSGFAAFSKVPFEGWAQIVIFAGMMEARFAENEKEPGDFGFGNLGACGFFGPVKDPAERTRKLNAEIANGRLAMFAIMALFFQNGVSGSTGSELYGFGEYSTILYLKYLVPSFLAVAYAGEVFRAGPDEKFLKYFKRTDYYGKNKRI